MNYFYILKSEIDFGYYYGSTTNLKKRVAEHNAGLVRSTKFRAPLALVYYEAYQDIINARLREKQVKLSGSVRAALHKRIN